MQKKVLLKIIAALLVAFIIFNLVSAQILNKERKQGKTAWGQHFDGLSQRIAIANIKAGKRHIHSYLTITAHGKNITIPKDIGIDINQLGVQARLHTHDSSGKIHAERFSHATLGQFFIVWGVPFTPTHLGPYRGPVHMIVNGKVSQAYRDLVLRDGQKIHLTIG